MSMQDQQKRYLKLNGEPVHMSLRDRVVTLPAFKAAGLTAAFNFCTVGRFTPATMALALGGGLLGLIIAEKGTETYSWLFNRLSFGKNFRDLAIDTTPTKDTPPTSPANLHAARDVRNVNAVMTFITGDKLPLVAFLSAGAFIDASQIADKNALAFGLCMFGSILSYCSFSFGKAALGQHRVLKHQYVIIDMPPPQKQEEKAGNALNKVLHHT